MIQNLIVARTQTNFRLDDWLKDQLDDYCEQYGLKKERLVEALVYGAVVKGAPEVRNIFELIQDLAARNKGPATPAAPAPVSKEQRLAAGRRLAAEGRAGRGRSSKSAG